MSSQHEDVPPPEILFESKDGARLLGVSANHFRILARLGKIEPLYTTPRGCRLFRPADVMKLRAERAQASR